MRVPKNQSSATKWLHVWTNWSCAAHGWDCDDSYIVSNIERDAAILAALHSKHRGFIEKPPTGDGSVAALAVKIQDGITWLGPSPNRSEAGEFMALANAMNSKLVKKIVELSAGMKEGEIIVFKKEIEDVYKK